MAEDLDVGANTRVEQIAKFPVPGDQPRGAFDDPRPFRVAEADQFGDFEFAVVAEFEVAPVEDLLGGQGGGGEEEGKGQSEESGPRIHHRSPFFLDGDTGSSAVNYCSETSNPRPQVAQEQLDLPSLRSGGQGTITKLPMPS